MYGVIFILIFVGGFVLIIIGISFSQIYNTNKLLKRLEHKELISCKIRFIQSSQGFGSLIGGFPIKAQLYFNNDLMVIGPQKNGFFSGISVMSMPIVFTRERAYNEKHHYNLKIPDTFKISPWKSITIKYKQPGVFFNIQISLLDKKDDDKIKLLRIWER